MDFIILFYVQVRLCTYVMGQNEYTVLVSIIGKINPPWSVPNESIFLFLKIIVWNGTNSYAFITNRLELTKIEFRS